MVQPVCRFFVAILLATQFFSICAKEEVLRFVSIRASNARLHVGPGLKYPVSWQYVKKDLPVEVLADYEHWRKVRDIDGAIGWLHKSLLSSKRTIWVVASQADLMRLPECDSKVMAQLGPGVIARLIDTHNGWCKVEVKCEEGVYRGWLNVKEVWGLLDREKEDD